LCCTQKDQLPSHPVDTSELHALTAPRYFVASECLGAVMKTNNTHALTARSNQLTAHVIPTLTTHLKVLEGTRPVAMNLRTWTSLMVQTRSHYDQYFIFNKLMKISLVLVPTPDWWRERPVRTSTNAGRKVLSGINHQAPHCENFKSYTIFL